ncbi:hypothetical protein TorRG33x02_182430, partial [Trema orientale]
PPAGVDSSLLDEATAAGADLAGAPDRRKMTKNTSPSFQFFTRRIAVRRPINPIPAPLDSS